MGACTIRFCHSFVGGGIFNRGNVTLVDTFLIENDAESAGGGMFSYPGTTLSMTRVQFEANTAIFGGGLDSHAIGLISDAKFIGNTGKFGGAVAVYSDAVMTFVDVSFTDNAANFEGGGFHITGDPVAVTLIGCVISANSAVYEGGGVLLKATSDLNAENATLQIYDSVISRNTAQHGAGIFNGAACFLYNTSIEQNNASRAGAGIYNSDNALVYLTNGSAIRSNDVDGTANALYNGGELSYVLPTRPGYYLPSVFRCELQLCLGADEIQSFSGNQVPCAQQSCRYKYLAGQLISRLVQGALNDDYPPSCGPAQYCPGDGLQYLVSPGYISTGGTPSTRTDVAPCPDGSYCTNGVATVCELGRFAVGSALERTSAAACQPCPEHSTTLSNGASSRFQCGCNSGYVFIEGGCVACPLYASCAFNTTLATMGINDGCWRLSEFTQDVRLCPRALGENDHACVGLNQQSALADSQFAAADGTSGTLYCREGQRGPLCRTCDAPRHYFRDASQRCVACPSTGEVVGVLLGGATLVATILGLAVLIGRMPRNRVDQLPYVLRQPAIFCRFTVPRLGEHVGPLAKFKVVVDDAGSNPLMRPSARLHATRSIRAVRSCLSTKCGRALSRCMACDSRGSSQDGPIRLSTLR
jgi:hypothetical protein